MASYERLAALDRFFLDVERNNTHMHVAGAMLFEAGPLRTADGGIDINRIRRYVEARLHLIPRYRQRLAYIPLENHPVWVDDDRMNIQYHVRHTSLPRPGSRRQLKRLTARIMSQQLDRGKPLWELWVVEGLRTDHFAIITKTHHCMVDGISGVDLMTVLLSPTPQEHAEPAPAWHPQPAPSGYELVRDEVWRRVTMPLDVVGFTRHLAARPRQVCARVAESVTGLAQALGEGFHGASETPLNRTIGSYRRFDWTMFDLAAVKAVKNALGGTVNDVVLATVAGAIGRFFEQRGVTRRQQEEMDFRVFCPVSVRSSADRGRLGNQVSGMLVALPVAERDPARRLRAIADTTAHVKDSKQALGAEVLAAVSEFTVPVLLSLGARLATRARAYNVIVTNVPGPQLPLYLLEARLVAGYPLVPLFVNQGLGIALLSYNGKLCWGFNADWELMPDLRDFVRAIRDSFDEVTLAAGCGVSTRLGGAAAHENGSGSDGHPDARPSPPPSGS
jgi:WS/DGAT/MGAT family acyltransferase